ncbi:MAG TPA: hypothetical protein DDW81_12120 [Cryomorphaceae bacterium]|nr:hypothetical protein [Owenweeksia sp.]HBF20837.1 hypothetical protein [Cryomorphaceae bacterium]
MKKLYVLWLAMGLAHLSAQTDYHFTLNPNIDTTKAVNRLLTAKLESFLSTKNQDLKQNDLWKAADFAEFQFPYRDIYYIEKGWSQKHHYNPTLIAISPAGITDTYILKIAFMETQDEHLSHLRAIYNIVAQVNSKEVTFSRYVNYAIRNWPIRKIGEITYYSSPQRSFSEAEARAQQKFIFFLCDFLGGVEPIPITYYSCTNPSELFNLKGFDYTYEMFFSETGGLAGFNNHLYSGNNSDRYDHEVVHLYLYTYLSTQLNPLLNEGMAMYLGGSSGIDYTTHRTHLAAYLKKHPQVQLKDHLNPYEDFYVNKDTSVPYMIGALLCELALKERGKKFLFDLIRKTDNEDVFSALEMTVENLDQKLKDLLSSKTFPPY